ncbi:MarR family winged helix-turn-helix transcriptional regulator [Sporomusa acidovorans]|uniref:HTH marR-type domain-containing protein n=1 Tax=Sporomusa acidovorans (strain ATCC 49682 / DSM 3132 / Mol) TaxID=1123286 RepID=A0ABZ3J7H3_SPOA4|nr:winged helix DNA-binding protein [Sporomusa acidovorans]SDE37493.1 DNA-binding transcriptional regulator, MarR family [Sporomusa acidovorans]
MDKKFISSMDEVFHSFIFKVRLDRFATYSNSLQRMSLLDLRIIRYIAERDNVQLKEIRDFLQIHNSTLSSAIKRLERRGIFKRVSNPEDGRSFIIKLTELGEKVHQKHREADLSLAKNIVDTFDKDEDRREFIRLMKIVSDKYENEANF